MNPIRDSLTQIIGKQGQTQAWAKNLALFMGKEIHYDPQGHAHFVRVKAHKQRLANLETSLDKIPSIEKSTSGKKLKELLEQDKNNLQYHPSEDLLTLLKKAREEAGILNTPGGPVHHFKSPTSSQQKTPIHPNTSPTTSPPAPKIQLADAAPPSSSNPLPPERPSKPGITKFITHSLANMLPKIELPQEGSDSYKLARDIIEKHTKALKLEGLSPSKQLSIIEDAIKHPYGANSAPIDTPIISSQERAQYIYDLKQSRHAQDQALGNELEDTYKFYLSLTTRQKASYDAEEVLTELSILEG